jgi:membrane dipeptidase
LLINLQGSLANPNVALNAAKRGDLASIPPGPTGRIDARATMDAQASGVAATCVTVGHVVGPGDPVARTYQELQHWHECLDGHSTNFALIRSVKDIEQSAAEGRAGVIFGFQNTEMLANDSSAVSAFAQLGVRVMQLTYNTPNAVGFGCLSPEDLGLTVFGKQALEAMNESGVLVDLSHAGPLTLRTAIDVSSKPIAVSHTACRDLVNNPRNVYDADLRLLAQRGGVVGIFAMPFLRESGQTSMEDYIRQIEHALKVVGADHVGIGTDGTITQVDDLPTYLHYLGEAIQNRRAAGISAPGEDEAVALFLPDMTGPTQFEVLATHLAQRGHAASTIDKLLGLNWQRLANDVWLVGSATDAAHHPSPQARMETL